jgi:hypothetical protein
MPSVSADAAYSQDVIETSEVVKLVLKKRMWFRRNLWNWRLPNCIWWKNDRLANSISLRSLWCTTGRPNGVWTSPHLSLWLKPLISIQKEPFCSWCLDKGQMYMHVKAFEYMIQSNALQREIYDWREEEVGSVNLKPSLKTILKT